MLRDSVVGFTFSVVCILFPSSHSQSTAGEAAAGPVCPTLLEAVLTLPEPPAPGATAKSSSQVVLTDLRTTSCDGVSLTGVAVSAGEVSGSTLPLKIKGKAENGSSRDLEIEPLFELLRGETRLDFDDDTDLEIEEGEDAGWKVTLKLPVDATRAEPLPRLRITLRRN